GKIKAFTMGAYAGDDEFITHIEKADVEYRGLYQAINWELAKALDEKVKYIDREEDMGLLNLRQSKEGYKPCKMYEKYYLEY
ncbi:MAG: phosphatidylglycerol lysyltransferase domain-containing protein, partial [Clostridia bacterium]|nr:phosphatidylglycerol lysyltransferase domain-containing protein [Clostridia bacterium]